MDTQTFLLKREALQERLAIVRAYAIASEKQASSEWWSKIPIFPIAGWLLMRGVRSAAGGGNPLIRSLMTTGALNVMWSFVRGWGLKRSTSFLASFLKR